MSTIRCTIVDAEGSVSFVGPPHAAKMLTAACATEPRDHRALLDAAEAYDPRFFAAVRAGLAAFDRRADGGDRALRGRLEPDQEGEVPPFRVVDDQTRTASLAPGRYGLVVYNLPARRIVQVQNSYAELRPSDRGRLRRDGRPVRAYYRYTLPEGWSIVP